MVEQKPSFKEKQDKIDRFIEMVNPYEKKPELKFDIRGYAKYLRDHNIPGNDVPIDVVEMFQR